jgi:alkaline phosphatase D
VQSGTGRFRTALAPGDLRPITFGATCCTKHGYSLSTLDHAASRQDLDAFLQLGDTVYCDGAEDLAGFRTKWSDGLAHPSHQVLRASTSLISTWDDHELFNNWNPEKLPEAQYRAGLQSFFEHQPLRRGPTDGIWRSLKWGDTAEIFVLDCRGERRPSKEQYISRAQQDWLTSGLSRSTAAFKLILNSVPISSFPGVLFGATADDRWEGFPEQREKILGFIETQGIRGVLWIAGDLHLGSMGRVSQKGPGSKAIEVLVGPGGQTSNPSPSYPSKPQFDWSTGRNNYTTFGLDPSALSVQVKYFDGRGTVLADQTYTL